MLKISAAVLVFFLATALIYRDQLQSYRSRAQCAWITHDARLPNFEKPSFEQAADGQGKAVVYVHAGVLPMSQYWCTAQLQDGKVTGARATHEWTLRAHD